MNKNLLAVALVGMVVVSFQLNASEPLPGNSTGITDIEEIHVSAPREISSNNANSVPNQPGSQILAVAPSLPNQAPEGRPVDAPGR